MKSKFIWADFLNADVLGRVRLNTVGTLESISATGLRLTDGQLLVLHDDELEADGIVTYSTEEHLCVVTIDWNAIRQHSSAEQLEHV